MELPELIKKKTELPLYAQAHLHHSLRRRLLYPALVGGLFVVLCYVWLTSAPSGFPQNSLVVVERGQTLSGLATKLKAEHIIRSEIVFKALVRIADGARGVDAGDYRLELPETVFSLARRFASGDYRLVPVKVTIPEGKNTYEIARLLQTELEHFDTKRFVELAEKQEGYLFPDTYFFVPGVDPATVVAAMKAAFDARVASLLPRITSFGKPLSDVVTMASILEEEARTPETLSIISGILWKRLAVGMPLQVDAVFPYIFRKDIRKVTLEDLEVESPYNTYKYKGLPPGPISNPGLKALEAAVSPVATPYYYYLTDAQGVMHYAVTHDQHVANKERYLR